MDWISDVLPSRLIRFSVACPFSRPQFLFCCASPFVSRVQLPWPCTHCKVVALSPLVFRQTFLMPFSLVTVSVLLIILGSGRACLHSFLSPYFWTAHSSFCHLLVLYWDSCSSHACCLTSPRLSNWSFHPGANPKYSKLLWLRENVWVGEQSGPEKCFRASVALMITEGRRVSVGDCGFLILMISEPKSQCWGHTVPQWKRLPILAGEIHKNLRTWLCTDVL